MKSKLLLCFSWSQGLYSFSYMSFAVVTILGSPNLHIPVIWSILPQLKQKSESLSYLNYIQMSSLSNLL